MLINTNEVTNWQWRERGHGFHGFTLYLLKNPDWKTLIRENP